MRGLAVLLMMQTHAYDSWLSPEARRSAFFSWSRLVGGYPGPMFLFLAGLSLALAAEGRFRKGRAAAEVRGEALRRGFEVLGYAVLFRLWMFTTSGFAKPADLLRVDVLNCIGLSMLLVAVAALGWSSARARWAGAGLLALGVALLTPLAWDAAWPGWIPRPLLAYVSGRMPGAFFPLFPWAGFTAAGALAGIWLARAHLEDRAGRCIAALAAAGALLIPLGLALDRMPTVYPRYDFWWTSPNYFLIKVGIVLLVLGFAYLWGRLLWASWPSVSRQLGRTSLLVYWAHIEVVYGGIVAGPLRGRLSLAQATLALVLLTLAMLALSLLRTAGPRWRRASEAGTERPPVTAGVEPAHASRAR
jgi:uncharacterized membrane protein